MTARPALRDTTSNTGVVFPKWAHKAKSQGAPPELRPENKLEEVAYTHKNEQDKRGGAPGFKTTQHNLDTDGYLWFKAVRADTAKRCPALAKPYTYFMASGAETAVKVPCPVLNMAYREAAMLAKREVRCGETGRLIASRFQNVHNDRVWYRIDEFEDIWVGARLSTLISIAKAEGLDYVPRHRWPRINWSSVTFN
jgi:hypothetical protein